MRNRTCESCNTTLQTQSCNGIPCKGENFDRSIVYSLVRLLVAKVENGSCVCSRACRVRSLVFFFVNLRLLFRQKSSVLSPFFSDFCSLKTTNPRKERAPKADKFYSINSLF